MGSRLITLPDVDGSIPVITDQLDDGYFRVRTGSTSGAERSYMRAMAEAGPGAVHTSEVTTILGKKPNGVGTVRDVLIKKSLCDLPRYGEIAFAVPLFDGYMKRWIPSLPAR